MNQIATIEQVTQDMKDLAKYRFRPLTYKDGSMDHYCLMRSLCVARNKPIDPAIDHAMKKLAWAGTRGAKDTLRDLQEAQLSIRQAIEAIEALEPSQPKTGETP